MPTIEFAMDGKTVEAAHDERLLDVCNREGISIPFGCQEGNCGTCLVRVTKGIETLGEPGEQEKTTLAIYATEPEHRLTCQCRAKGDLTLDWP